MAIFTQGSNSCYFIHIPRTGGRYVGNLFENTNGVKSKHNDIGIEIQNIVETHLHYPLYYEICPDNIPFITVVRNPYDKLLSSLKVMGNTYPMDYNIRLEDEFDCYKFIFGEILEYSRHNNWFLPQYKFINDNTFVWKYEWGFGKEFQEWVEEKTGIELNISKVEYGRIAGEGVSTENKLTLSEDSKRNIKKFYDKDYIKFDY